MIITLSNKNNSAMKFKIKLDPNSKRFFITNKGEKLLGYNVGEIPAGFNKRESMFFNISGLTFTNATRLNP